MCSNGIIRRSGPPSFLIIYCSIIEVQRSQDSHLIADQTGDHTTPFAVCLKLCLTNTVSTTVAISDNELFILKSL